MNYNASLSYLLMTNLIIARSVPWEKNFCSELLNRQVQYDYLRSYLYLDFVIRVIIDVEALEEEEKEVEEGMQNLLADPIIDPSQLDIRAHDVKMRPVEQ
ncbi:unnamed protein product [Citrullus colocynthis]|uniref:Uncharacterized protein n=1 Tax=Citrullus colocynthis TaxID=252529 RepID=A0ABP0Z3S9_9ROSI